MALVLAGCAGGAGADVIFIVDTNADVTLENFQVMKDFIKGIVRDPRMASSSFGVILFDDTTLETITLDKNDNLLQQIDTIPYTPKIPAVPRKTHAGLVALQGAFNYASKVLNSVRPKYGILLTNGISDNTEETVRQAQSIAGLGIRLIVIGRLDPDPVQQRIVISELERIVSPPREVFLSPILNWSDLTNMGVSRLTVNVVCGSSGMQIHDTPKNYAEARIMRVH